MLVELALEFVSAPNIASTPRRLPRIDQPMPAGQIGIATEGLVEFGENKAGAFDPSPGRHIRDRVGLADYVRPIAQVIVENLVMALGFAPIAVERIVQTRWRGALEMNRLAGERS